MINESLTTKDMRRELQAICSAVPARSCMTRGCPLSETCKLFGYTVPEALNAEQIKYFYTKHQKMIEGVISNE